MQCTTTTVAHDQAHRNARKRLNTASPLLQQGDLGRVGLAQVYAINAIGKVTASRDRPHQPRAPPPWIARYDWSSLIFHRIWFYNLSSINQCLPSMFCDRQNAPMCLQMSPRTARFDQCSFNFHRFRFYNLNIINQRPFSVFFDGKKAPMCLQKSHQITRSDGGSLILSSH